MTHLMEHAMQYVAVYMLGQTYTYTELAGQFLESWFHSCMVEILEK